MRKSRCSHIIHNLLFLFGVLFVGFVARQIEYKQNIINIYFDERSDFIWSHASSSVSYTFESRIYLIFILLSFNYLSERGRDRNYNWLECAPIPWIVFGTALEKGN